MASNYEISSLLTMLDAYRHENASLRQRLDQDPSEAPDPATSTTVAELDARIILLRNELDHERALRAAAEASRDALSAEVEASDDRLDAALLTVATLRNQLKDRDQRIADLSQPRPPTVPPAVAAALAAAEADIEDATRALHERAAEVATLRNTVSALTQRVEDLVRANECLERQAAGLAADAERVQVLEHELEGARQAAIAGEAEKRARILEVENAVLFARLQAFALRAGVGVSVPEPFPGTLTGTPGSAPAPAPASASGFGRSTSSTDLSKTLPRTAVGACKPASQRLLGTGRYSTHWADVAPPLRALVSDLRRRGASVVVAKREGAGVEINGVPVILSVSPTGVLYANDAGSTRTPLAAWLRAAADRLALGGIMDSVRKQSLSGSISSYI